MKESAPTRYFPTNTFGIPAEKPHKVEDCFSANSNASVVVESAHFRPALRKSPLLGATLVFSILAFYPLARAADEPAASASTPAPGTVSQKDSSKNASLDALVREEEEMRRKEEEMLRRAVAKSGAAPQATTPPKLTQIPTQPTQVKVAPTSGPTLPRPTPTKKRVMPRPTATATPEPTLVKLKGVKPSETASPVPAGTPLPTASASATPAAQSKSPEVKPSPRPSRVPTKAVAPTPARSEAQRVTPPKPSAQTRPPTKAGDSRDSQIGLLRAQLTAATEHNRQLEAELEALRTQLTISETEVERLNDFLNEQGRDYLNQATGGSPSVRQLPRRRPFRERLSMTTEEVNPNTTSPGNRLSDDSAQPARAVEPDRNISIASVVSDSAIGRQGPSASSAAMGRLAKGTQVTVERETQGWYRVFTPRGVRVWVAAQDLGFGSDGAVPPLRKNPASSILPPDQLPSSVVTESTSGASAEDRALELLKQSMGQQP